MAAVAILFIFVIWVGFRARQRENQRRAALRAQFEFDARAHQCWLHAFRANINGQPEPALPFAPLPGPSLRRQLVVCAIAAALIGAALFSISHAHAGDMRPSEPLVAALADAKEATKDEAPHFGCYDQTDPESCQQTSVGYSGGFRYWRMSVLQKE
jgi:hypothetical protein